MPYYYDTCPFAKKDLEKREILLFVVGGDISTMYLGQSFATFLHDWKTSPDSKLEKNREEKEEFVTSSPIDLLPTIVYFYFHLYLYLYLYLYFYLYS